ncbi:bifunctional 4-hydroxy-2-oxoglutarate aldolase/2-dehydro-3-deoxy-phosphogluconate aldolase [Brevibacillus panacihumi]|uniref:Bifunctional 4-hydroxy-2-oxoglutarate aldolase/2-dehydro-3-deoxy-phosphogluconate aldolase n=1 Tax=Brevibacillus panacihumi TaxID=497735 RepID=A0A3M8D4F8_9BACL|nr:bifunctional 4-hydroxy-2-oxoglutarate aldolase/2-dehydro-3-deoxy-phosphogluconate aldolase [Brevibacillus panacihumi]RNB82912.1 bifunctional 4-hydroxy-2-oxoglutarate aldolase/2-dehydro-3-deoxy-phosphogluconate aldolase [Brevibacillus panacihumi]
MTIERLKAIPLVPVLRKIPYDKSHDIVQALLDGGIEAVEITMETERAEAIIRESVESYGDRALVGAGTVLDVADCRRAIEAGAQFIVAPVLEEAVVRYAADQGIPVIPGVFTPSEMLRAVNLGAAMIKLFPASVLGPSFIKDVKGPLSHIPIMCTGGITLDTAKAYLDAGANAVGAGSALLRKDLIEAGDWTGLTEEAKCWLAAIRD